QSPSQRQCAQTQQAYGSEHEEPPRQPPGRPHGDVAAGHRAEGAIPVAGAHLESIVPRQEPGVARLADGNVAPGVLETEQADLALDLAGIEVAEGGEMERQGATGPI